ncbi:MAG: cell division protein FtsZ [Bacteroidales bacterium]|nr:cell division protein FtsZ [Bacteroidales bacterium]
MFEDFNIDLDVTTPPDWTRSDQIIKVIGVGGGGCNAVSYMYRTGIEGCSFVVCNTDSQALECSPVPVKIQMGAGLGAGTNPIKGRNAAIDSQAEIEKKILDTGTQMLFITAGMGGGTGTGATPIIAKMAKEKGILTVAVVTIPFKNEGDRAMSRAIDGIQELEKNVDSLLIINNEKLYDHFGDKLTHDAFPKADEVLTTAVKGIIEIIKKPGYINVDFEDVKTMMKDSGMALMGYGEGSGPNRIEEAVRQAFESPLLNDFDLKTAKNVLVNITGGKNEQGLTMDDMSEINKRIDEYTGGANNFKRGLIWDENPEVGDQIHITSIVTGLKFIDIVGSRRDMGNYIMITRGFRYDKNESASTRGILIENSYGKTIGYTSDNQRLFRYDPEKKPALLVSSGDPVSDLENIPSIRRI